jgi:hypothetical protein
VAIIEVEDHKERNMERVILGKVSQETKKLEPGIEGGFLPE